MRIFSQMTAEIFCRWMTVMKLSNAAAARALDVSRNTIAKYRREGAPVAIGFACAAIAMGLPRWGIFE